MLSQYLSNTHLKGLAASYLRGHTIEYQLVAFAFSTFVSLTVFCFQDQYGVTVRIQAALIG